MKSTKGKPRSPTWRLGEEVIDSHVYIHPPELYHAAVRKAARLQRSYSKYVNWLIWRDISEDIELRLEASEIRKRL